MKMKLSYIVIPVFIGILFYSCKEDFLEISNPNAVTDTKFYKNREEAIQAVNAVYSVLQKEGIYNWQLRVANDLRSDEYGGTLKIVGAKDQYEIETFTATAQNAQLAQHWNDLFTGVFRANQAIEKIPLIQDANDPLWTGELKSRLVGEAKFLRALYYFNLVLLFGDVPLISKLPQSAEEFNVARSPVNEVYEGIIIPDLLEAVQTLPSVTAYRGSTELGRASKGAAQALLGKVYLFRGQYNEAKAQFKAVVESGDYELVASFRDNHDDSNENNKESLFEIQFITGGDGWSASVEQRGSEGCLFPIWGGHPSNGDFYNWMPTIKLVSEFEPEDTMRKNATAFYPGGPRWDPAGKNEPWELLDAAGNRVRPEGTFAMRKFIQSGRDVTNTQSGINYRLIRYADVLLMYAEALNETDGPAAALPFINLVRRRAKVPDYPTAAFPASSSADVFNIIMHERIVELGGESHRWNDLCRWDNLGKIDMTPIIKNPTHPDPRGAFDKNKHKLLPIPQGELDVNPLLTQNP